MRPQNDASNDRAVLNLMLAEFFFGLCRRPGLVGAHSNMCFRKRGLRRIVPSGSLFYVFTRSTAIHPSHAAFHSPPSAVLPQGTQPAFGPASLAAQPGLYVPVEG
jgi:hypothetical protein